MKCHIAVDGLVASGKSTICKLIAQRLGFVFISSGGFYRLFAYVLDQKKLIHSNFQTQVNEIKKHDFSVFQDQFFLAKQNVTALLRQEHIATLASYLATLKPIRCLVNDHMKIIANQYKLLIIDGRDVALKILPNAQLKFFFVCSLRKRVQRRKEQLQSKNKFLLLWKIWYRDFVDKHRKNDPLKPQKQAIIINTSKTSVEATYQQVTSYIKKVC